MKYTIELNGKLIKSLSSKDKAVQLSQSYANENNVVRIWDDKRNLIIEL